MRTLALSLAGLTIPMFWPATALSAHDTRACFEDQVAVWSPRTNAHTRCLNTDDRSTARILHRRGLPR